MQNITLNAMFNQFYVKESLTLCDRIMQYGSGFHKEL